MKKVFLAFVMFVVSTCAFAQNDLDLRGLTETQKAEIALQTAKMKEAAKSNVPVAQKAVEASDAALNISTKWANVGKELALGIVHTAKELGVAANEFASTPLGKVATGLIIWNYMGKDLLSMAMSLMIFFIGLPTIWYVYRKLVVETVEYHECTGIFGRKYYTPKVVRTVDGEQYFFKTIAFLAASIGCAIVAIHYFPA